MTTRDDTVTGVPITADPNRLTRPLVEGAVSWFQEQTLARDEWASTYRTEEARRRAVTEAARRSQAAQSWAMQWQSVRDAMTATAMYRFGEPGVRDVAALTPMPVLTEGVWGLRRFGVGRITAIAAQAENDPIGTFLSQVLDPGGIERYHASVAAMQQQQDYASRGAAYEAQTQATRNAYSAQASAARAARADEMAARYGFGAGAQPVTVDSLELTRPPGEPPAEGEVGSSAWRQYARDMQTAIAAEQFGLQAFRDTDGQVTFFDDIVGRFIRPEDMQRNLLGGFDPLYRVNQRNRLGAGNIQKPVSLSQQLRNDAVSLGISLPHIPDTYLARHAESQPSRQRVWSGANYYEGDQWSTFAGMSANDKMQVQQRMIAAGYLNPDSVVPGVWDYASAQAAQYLMTDANGNGVTWVEMLAEREMNMPSQRGRGGGGGGVRINPFVAPTYIAPDYDTLKQGVRQAFDSILGRNVMDHELKLLADSMGADYRLAYEAEVKAARDEYDRQVAAIRSGARYAGEGETVQGVNPMDSLMEQMLERYAPEVERTEQIHERAYNANLVMQAMGVLDRSVG